MTVINLFILIAYTFQVESDESVEVDDPANEIDENDINNGLTRNKDPFR